MKNRRRKRENRKKKQEMFDIRNNTGVLDPTPYYDVLRMRDGNFYAKNNDRRNTVHEAS